MQVSISQEAAAWVSVRGGALWVWAARPRMCCPGTPSYMQAATSPPAGLAGFRHVAADELELWFRAPAGMLPDVLEIALYGRRRHKLAAYWDGCLFGPGG